MMLSLRFLIFGDGFVGLSPTVVKYIENGSFTKAEQLVTTEDLTDIELRDIIESKVRIFKCLIALY